jgi:TonB family protein
MAGFLPLLVLLSCGKQPGTQVVVGGDTMTVEGLLQLRPEGARDEWVLPGVGVQVILARRDTARQKELTEQLTDQLNLRSDHRWGHEQVSSLYRASIALRHSVDSLDSFGAVIALIDSLRSRLQGLPQGLMLDSLAVDTLRDEQAQIPKEAMARILQSAFRIDAEEAFVLADFVASEEMAAMDSAAVGKMIAGLVWDSAKASENKPRRKKAPARSRVKRPDNSALALRYRPYESIRDSIAKHIPNIRALYRKELKRDQSLEGVVRVAFRISASGEVMSATVVGSDIDEPRFLKPLSGYVRDIRFLPIPEKVGPMSFEFPFEFKSER